MGGRVVAGGLGAMCAWEKWVHGVSGRLVRGIGVGGGGVCVGDETGSGRGKGYAGGKERGGGLPWRILRGNSQVNPCADLLGAGGSWEAGRD